MSFPNSFLHAGGILSQVQVSLQLNISLLEGCSTEDESLTTLLATLNPWVA